jgi:hypothetical protein
MKEPFEIVTVPGAQAYERLLALRAERRGVIPVAFGDREDHGRVMEALEYNDMPFAECLRIGVGLDVEEWMQERLDEEPELFETESEDDDGQPGANPPLTLALDILSGKPKEEVLIGLIPVAQPWEVAAYLRPGGWNDCPGPEVHVAMFKRWYERHGAIITGLSGDTIEMSCERPPATADAARTLAREQFVYCTDIVHQGVQSETNLAKVLLNGRNWFFWWD